MLIKNKKNQIYAAPAVIGLNSTLKALGHIIKMHIHLKWCPVTIGCRDPKFHVSLFYGLKQSSLPERFRYLMCR